MSHPVKNQHEVGLTRELRTKLWARVMEALNQGQCSLYMGTLGMLEAVWLKCDTFGHCNFEHGNANHVFGDLSANLEILG